MKIYKLLSSKLLAIWLIMALTISSVIAMIIPHGGKIFKSYWFLAIIFLFIINILLCTSKQIKYIIKSRKKNIPLFKPIGTAIFHLSLITITIGALLTLGYSMQGYMMIGVGETIEDSHQNYSYIEEGKLFSEKHGMFSLKLEDQKKHFNGEKLDYTSDKIQLIRNGEEILDSEIDKGQPASVGNLSIYHHDSGYAPLLEIKNKGKTAFVSNVIFNTQTKSNNDIFILPKNKISGLDMAWEGEFYPNAAQKKDGAYYNKNDLVQNPTIKLNFNGAIGNHQIVLKKGQQIKIGDYEIIFRDLTYWSGIDVVYDSGSGVALAGSVLLIIALAMMYIPISKFNQKRVM